MDTKAEPQPYASMLMRKGETAVTKTKKEICGILFKALVVRFHAPLMFTDESLRASYVLNKLEM